MHVGPDGAQMTHGKRGEPNGEGKREKHVFFPSQSHTGINRRENQVAPWFSRACSIIVAREPRPRRDDGDHLGREG